MGKLRAYWKWITGAVGIVAGVVAAVYGGGEVVVRADDWVDGVDAGIIVAQAADKKANQALEYQRLQVEREKAAEAQEREKWRTVYELCLNGTIKSDDPMCAKATAALK